MPFGSFVAQKSVQLGLFFRRFSASRAWATCIAGSGPSVWEAYQSGVKLLLRLGSLNITARHYVLSKARGFSREACAFAIRQAQLEKPVRRQSYLLVSSS